jgi:hypothetical protein
MRPVLINHKVSGDRYLRVDLHPHPCVLPTGDLEHILTDLTSVSLRQTNIRGSSHPNWRDVASLHRRQLLGKWDNTILSEKQLSFSSPPTSSRCLHVLSALQKLQLAPVTTIGDNVTTKLTLGPGRHLLHSTGQLITSHSYRGNGAHICPPDRE